MPVYYYTYSGGYAGTDEHGLVEAESESQAAEFMEDEAMELAVQWAEDPRGGNICEDDEGNYVEPDEDVYANIESDLDIELYDPAKHNRLLHGDEEGYISEE